MAQSYAIYFECKWFYFQINVKSNEFIAFLFGFVNNIIYFCTQNQFFV